MYSTAWSTLFRQPSTTRTHCWVLDVSAAVVDSNGFLGYVLKQKVNPFLCDGDGASGEEAKVPWLEVYKPYLVAVYSQGPRAQQPRDLGLERSHQIMVQFLYRRKDLDYTTHKLLVLVHQEVESQKLDLMGTETVSSY
uniref:Uncharacterized protein n=1 Tax=Timema bartmani TaxID=61472 RepID=A0A7R9F181_9NEOP|nr:unnamed protein product [Timema bartmani]